MASLHLPYLYVVSPFQYRSATTSETRPVRVYCCTSSHCGTRSTPARTGLRSGSRLLRETVCCTGWRAASGMNLLRFVWLVILVLCFSCWTFRSRNCSLHYELKDTSKNNRKNVLYSSGWLCGIMLSKRS